jgi:hypothetical protein
MNITDEPMPGVAPTGTRGFWGIARKGQDITVLTTYLKDMEYAKRWARGVAPDYDEVIVLDATMVYRVWHRDSKDAKRVAAEAEAI